MPQFTVQCISSLYILAINITLILREWELNIIFISIDPADEYLVWKRSLCSRLVSFQSCLGITVHSFPESSLKVVVCRSKWKKLKSSKNALNSTSNSNCLSRLTTQRFHFAPCTFNLSRFNSKLRFKWSSQPHYFLSLIYQPFWSFSWMIVL